MRHVLTPLFILWFLLLPTLGLAQELSCPDLPKVEVTPGDKGEIVLICLATQQALDFLADYNLTPKRRISFEIVEERIDNRGAAAYGSYDSLSDRIRLMSYAAIQNGAAQPLMYGEPFDRVHYVGAIAHEVAHAVVQHNLTFKPISPGPQEYLAHATQLAAMPTDRRAALIQAMDVEPWVAGDAISDLYMALEPGKFAVKSYLHLTQMTDPASFIALLLNSKWFYVYVP